MNKRNKVTGIISGIGILLGICFLLLSIILYVLTINTVTTYIHNEPRVNAKIIDEESDGLVNTYKVEYSVDKYLYNATFNTILYKLNDKEVSLIIDGRNQVMGLSSLVDLSKNLNYYCKYIIIISFILLVISFSLFVILSKLEKVKINNDI